MNSLLRLDGTTGEPAPPFERPRQDMDFFVLEIQAEDEMELWCPRVAALLHEHAGYLTRMRDAGAKPVLFVESSSAGMAWWRFEAEFLKALSDLGVALEISASDSSG